MSAINIPSEHIITAALIDEVGARLVKDKPVRLALPGGGALNMDRLLPFLCVYRRNPARRDEGTQRFVTAEASYLTAPGDEPVRPGLRRLVRRIAESAAQQLGAFLLLEIWSADDHRFAPTVDAGTGETLLPEPYFRILSRQPHRPEGTVATLEFALQRIKVYRMTARVECDLSARNHPPGLTPLLSPAVARRINCHLLGLEVRPIYRDRDSGEVYSGVLGKLHRGVSRALKKAFFTYMLHRTSVRPQHYYALGRRSLPSLVWNVDRRLSEVSGQFKFLLQVTPVNAERAWQDYCKNDGSKLSVFQYRPLETDPLLLKRRLSKIPCERIEDPTLAHLFRETQDELDRQITMLSDINSRRFMWGSLQVYGHVETSLSQLARDILTRLGEPSDESGELIDARDFARLANREIRRYRRRWPSFSAQCIVRNDMYSGLLSIGGNLLIGRQTTIPQRRVDALIQHEVGTHLITYYNGGAQPLKLLRVGLAGYDGLQEGLAVLAEYLVGGLSRGRMRMLAGRVLAAEQMIQGAPFGDTFRLLTETHHFEPRTAYTIVLRVHRGGGLTKDIVYLRGLVEILQYLGKGGDLDLLFVGKLARDHIPVIRELLQRGVLRQPPLRPHYLDDERAAERLDRLRRGAGVLDLLE